MKYNGTVQLMKKTSQGLTYYSFCKFGLIKETPKNRKIDYSYSIDSQATQDYIDALLKKGYKFTDDYHQDEKEETEEK